MLQYTPSLGSPPEPLLRSPTCLGLWSRLERRNAVEGAGHCKCQRTRTKRTPRNCDSIDARGSRQSFTGALNKPKPGTYQQSRFVCCVGEHFHAQRYLHASMTAQHLSKEPGQTNTTKRKRSKSIFAKKIYIYFYTYMHCYVCTVTGMLDACNGIWLSRTILPVPIQAALVDHRRRSRTPPL